MTEKYIFNIQKLNSSLRTNSRLKNEVLLNKKQSQQPEHITEETIESGLYTMMEKKNLAKYFPTQLQSIGLP